MYTAMHWKKKTDNKLLQQWEKRKKISVKTFSLGENKIIHNFCMFDFSLNREHKYHILYQ